MAPPARRPANPDPVRRPSLRLGQEASIGYLSHTATEVQLYLQETLTFLTFTAEASVSLPASG